MTLGPVRVVGAGVVVVLCVEEVCIAVLNYIVWYKIATSSTQHVCYTCVTRTKISHETCAHT